MSNDRDFIVTVTFKMRGEVPKTIPEEYIADCVAQDFRCETQFSYDEESFEEYYMAQIGDESTVSVKVREFSVCYDEKPFCEHCGDGHKDFGATISLDGVNWCIDCVCLEDDFTEYEIEQMRKKEKEGLKEYYKNKLKELED